MIDTAEFKENYSGIVKLRLKVGDRDYRLSKLGPGYVVFREPALLGPGDAEVVMTVDDRVHRWPVNLPEGANASMSRVAAVPLDAG
jgi:hypothetical protein